jgi:hypothetical protein
MQALYTKRPGPRLLRVHLQQQRGVQFLKPPVKKLVFAAQSSRSNLRRIRSHLVKQTTLPAVFLMVLGLSTPPATPQTRSTFPTPPEGQNHDMVEKAPITTIRHIDFEKLQSEADDLAALRKPYRRT